MNPDKGTIDLPEVQAVGISAEENRRDLASKAVNSDEHLSTDHLLTNLRGRTISSGFVTAISQGAKFVLTLGSTVILARLLTPRDFGLVAMVTAVSELFVVLRDAGLSTATIQRQNLTQAQVSNLFWINILLSALVTATIASLAPAIAWFYKEPRLVTLTIVLSATSLLRGATVQHVALLNRQMRFKAIAAIEVSSVAAAFSCGVTMALLGFGYWSLVGATFANEGVNFILTWTISRWRPQLPRRGSDTGPLLHFGALSAASNVILSFALSADNLLIGWRYGANAVGLYSRALSLLNRPIEQITFPITRVFIPALARLQDDPARYRRAFLQGYEAIALGTFLMTSIILALAHPITLVLLGHKWEAAAGIFACFTLVAVTRPLIMCAHWLFISQGRGRDILVTTSILSVSSLVAYVVGLPFGVLGVALMISIFGVLIRLPVSYYNAGRRGPVSSTDLWAVFLRHLPLWFFVFGITWAAKILTGGQPPLIQLLVCGPVGLLAGVGFIWSFPRLRLEALQTLNAFQELRNRSIAK